MTPEEIGKSCYSNTKSLAVVDTQTHAQTAVGPCSIPPAPTLTNKLIKAHSYTSNAELLIDSIQQWRKAGMTTINSDFTCYKGPINKNKNTLSLCPLDLKLNNSHRTHARD